MPRSNTVSLTESQRRNTLWQGVFPIIKGAESRANLVSRSVIRGDSSQDFYVQLTAMAKCFGHIECDAIIMDNGTNQTIPALNAKHPDAELTHEASIGKIADDQLIKLMSLGLSYDDAVKPVLEKWMDEEGLSDCKIKGKVLSLMDASKTHFEKVKGTVDPASLPAGVRIITSSPGMTKTDEDGNLIEYPGETLLAIAVDALEIQAKALDLACKILGLYEPESRTGPKATLDVQIVVHRDPDSPPVPVGPLKLQAPEHSER